MKVRYFVVDHQGQLRKTSQAEVESLFQGRCRAETLGCRSANELRLVSVICTEVLLPTRLYVLRLPLTNGRFTEENRLTLRLFAMPECMTAREMVEHHTEGWPRDFFRQLAVVLDVPVASLHVPLGVGGPLFTAATMPVTLLQALRHLH